MRRVSVLGSAWILALASLAAAAEIDSLTGRELPLADSAEALERRLNAALEAAVARANRESGACDPELLYRELRAALATPFIGHVIAESLNRDEAMERRRIRREDSIYRDLGLFDNISVHWKDLSAVIRVGDAFVGVDKIGHFVVEGWDYFETAYLEGEGIDAALDRGERSERTYFGEITTGVYSHADLVANFEGMRFWLRVLGEAEDPLGLGWRAARPYVRCGRRFWIVGERRWQLTRALELDAYVTPVWDEAVNCPRYRNLDIAARVEARIGELEAASGSDYACPIDAGACARARERYRDWAPRLLHSSCLAAEAPGRRWLPWWE